jgi:hypothetical protein
MDATLKHPFNMIVAGPSQSGKTEFVKRLIDRSKEMVNNPPEQILFYYAEWQPSYKGLVGKVKFIEGLPNALPDGKERTWIILDDLMSEMESSKQISLLFTRGTHHRNCSVVLIMQNFFHKGREVRTITLNAHYIALFKNPRDKSQISSLARQLYPNDVNFLQEAYDLSTSEPHSYLFLDLKQDSPETMRVRSNIFSENGKPPAIYISKKFGK